MRLRNLFIPLICIGLFVITGCICWQHHRYNRPINQLSYSAVTLSGIRLTTENVQKEFVYEDEFNYDNLVVTAIYSDNTAKVVNSYEVLEPDMKQIGRQNIYVLYEDVSAEYYINIEHSPKSTILEVADWLYTTVKEEDQKFNIYKTYDAVGINEDKLKAIVDRDLIVDGFELLEDWQDGICYYIYHTNIIMSYNVYSDTAWVKDWKEAEPETEGAEETDVTRLIISSYYSYL